MGNVQYHAESSANLFGGTAEDYVRLHKFLDQSKLYLADWRHRALLHTTFGVALCEQMFGDLYVRLSDGIKVCTRTLAERHILEDLRFVPTPADFLRTMPIASWMNGISREQLRRMQNLTIEENDRSTTKRCECGHQLIRGARFCCGCGKSLILPTEASEPAHAPTEKALEQQI